MIGQHEPEQPAHVDLPKALAAMLGEALTALEESFHDLTDEQFWARPFADRHTIGTMVLHLMETLDTYACRFQTGKHSIPHDKRFDIWELEGGERPEDASALPSVKEVLRRLSTLRGVAEEAIAYAREEDLRGTRRCEDWWIDRGRTAGDAYLRAIGHAMAHVRQIWLTRGAIGLTGKDGWPNQHLA
jgi:hypothetical protein